MGGWHCRKGATADVSACGATLCSGDELFALKENKFIKFQSEKTMSQSAGCEVHFSQFYTNWFKTK
jgi:hypothetical protein